MPLAEANGITISYEVFGDSAHPVMLLIMGAGAQMLEWDEEFCQALASHGYCVVRFDNRDVGHTSKTTTPLTFVGNWSDVQAPRLDGQPPYTLRDMAADAIGLLDAIGVQRAHVVGASLGGMIAQRMAIDCPERVLTLTAIMSRLGVPESVTGTAQDTTASDYAPPLMDRETYVEVFVAARRALAGPMFEAERVRDLLLRQFDRSYDPMAGFIQLAAAASDGDRAGELSQLTCPALIVQGSVDPLAPVSEGRALAAAIPGARFVIVPDMGHELPRASWPVVLPAIVELARRSRAEFVEP